MSKAGHRKRRERGNVVPRKQLEVAENKWSDWKITHYFLIFMSNYQFLLCNAHIGAWKCYCDTPARFRVPLVMINTLLKMTENFWFPEIWLIVPRKEKIFLCPGLRISCEKRTHLGGTYPYSLHTWVPPQGFMFITSCKFIHECINMIHHDKKLPRHMCQWACTRTVSGSIIDCPAALLGQWKSISSFPLPYSDQFLKCVKTFIILL